MQEPEAEIQASANLSPVSPSPVQPATALAVPALQDTVDTLDALVAAAMDPNISVAEPVPAAPEADVDADGENNDDVVDDDSFDEAYGDGGEDPQAAAAETSEAAVKHPATDQEAPDGSDDYAKMFDSPVAPEDDQGDEAVEHGDTETQRDVSSAPQDSNAMASTSEKPPSPPSETSPVAPPTAQDLAQSASAAQVTGSVEPKHDAQTEAVSQAANVQPNETQPTLPQQNAGTTSSSQGADGPAVDIQQLMADLTSQHAEPRPNAQNGQSEPNPNTQVVDDSSSAPAAALPSSSTLPPRPPMPQATPQSHASQHHPGANIANAVPSTNVPVLSQPGAYPSSGAPDTTEPIGHHPQPPSGVNVPVPMDLANVAAYAANTSGYSADSDGGYQRAWDQFVTDERQYMSEAKWDRFPEGSRIFIGNLSSEKVSKRDVFDVFYRFGRLAQISLKSAFGFVQYHTVDEGRRAIESLQGIEIKGRRIHLEISRVQDKSKKERNRSPDRGRGRDGGRRSNDRFGQPDRDDYRPGRTHSPRRNDYRDNGMGRDRGGYYESGRTSRGRSRSPDYGREKESYRRRSPSPYGRSRHESELDIPRRYGADVPDVQMILQPDLNREFVAWVEGILKGRGLKTAVMYLHPRTPKDQVVSRQAAEGVHAVIDLDPRAQSTGRIPVQAFDRSAGTSNVRFDQYVDLDPNTAAEIILRAKASGAPKYSQPPQPYGGGYNPPSYAAPPPHQQAPPQYPPQQPAQPSIADIASVMGQVDNATLQRLLATVQAPAQQAPPAQAPPSANPPMDIQALLGVIGGNNSAPPQQGLPPQMYGAPQHGQPQGGQQGDSAAQVQNIMAQLARFRQ